MCGIAGFFEDRGQDLPLKLDAMGRRLSERGPDDSGRWVCPASGMALAHRRLAILDLSPLGHQPMQSASGRYVTVFNGEIYNFKRLQVELEQFGFLFRGGSDTEVLLAAFEHWGVREAVSRFVGMFALALWDTREQRLHLIRDRAGKKPLYYGWNQGVFFFASEVKALRGHPRFSGVVDRQALSFMVRYGYVPSPLSIFQGIRKLPPASILSLSLSELRGEGSSSNVPVCYWNALQRNLDAHELPLLNDRASAQQHLSDVLTDSVSIRMLADVPIGAFLSGGIDSSLVTAIMQRQSSTPIRTFSIGFHEKRYDEAPYAARIARHLGTDHTELYISAADTLAVIPRMGKIFDEPFGDQSQVPTFLVSELARRSVTVALSGDGGDELFAGYPRYNKTDTLWSLIRPVPRPLRSLAGRGVRIVPESIWEFFFATAARLMPGYFSEKNVSSKLDRMSYVLSLNDFDQLYQRIISFHEHDMTLVRDCPPTSLESLIRISDPEEKLSRVERMMMIDLLSYLPDDILVKVDRCSMAVSLEARAPLLDHRLIELSWRLPMRFKAQGGISKVLLRDLLATMVPRELFERPKMGFGIPYGEWLRGSLKDWCEDLLSTASLESHGLLETDKVRKLWRDFLGGRDAYSNLLWNLAMFQSWQREWGNAS